MLKNVYFMILREVFYMIGYKILKDTNCGKIQIYPLSNLTHARGMSHVLTSQVKSYAYTLSCFVPQVVFH